MNRISHRMSIWADRALDAALQRSRRSRHTPIDRQHPIIAGVVATVFAASTGASAVCCLAFTSVRIWSVFAGRPLAQVILAVWFLLVSAVVLGSRALREIRWLINVQVPRMVETSGGRR